ncbi:DUF418 domain-containing protein [Sphingopyxis witflariensis]|uniref:DUF418 domain-containing protein n=1 Tax=Sphingopyxis witflariensis TaxID=173675 RepID=A0A246JXP3_9SPHN|nr:DUF418 domain-containing protein [Sphingopyxis witflariensis]OWQ97871.1 hypothetical protein CDQ91_09495 [Sphingopyxis witflariensis]
MGEYTEVATPRLITLDALRGFAVMGILAMNIVAFAMPEMAYITPRAYAGETPSDLAAWALGFILFDGKMRGLFSILFGASMLLIIDRAEASGRDPASVHYRRMAWLAVFGFCHYAFIWWGDILFLYAAVGCVAFRFRDWEARRLIIWAIGLFTLGVAIMTMAFGAQLAAVRAADTASSSTELVEAGRAIRAEYASMNEGVATELALYRGGYLPILAERLDKADSPLIMLVMNFLETLPLMMIGMALFRNGFLTGAWSRADYRRVARHWLPPGLLLTLLVTWVQWRSGFDNLVAINAFLAWAAPGRLMMTIGYAALFVLLIQRYASGTGMARVAAAGRMAFSNYIGTSIVMTSIFYGYGLGLFGSVDRMTLYLFVIGGAAAMLLWSKPWLDRFLYGPLEWLWRSLARRSLQPMRRTA